MDKYIDLSTVYTSKDITEDILKLHGVLLTYIHAWRAKEKALKLVHGDPIESYAKLLGNFGVNDELKMFSIVKMKKN